jgi:hypothetical protein
MFADFFQSILELLHDYSHTNPLGRAGGQPQAVMEGLLARLVLGLLSLWLLFSGLAIGASALAYLSVAGKLALFGLGLLSFVSLVGLWRRPRLPSGLIIRIGLGMLVAAVLVFYELLRGLPAGPADGFWSQAGLVSYIFLVFSALFYLVLAWGCRSCLDCR